MNGSEFKKQQAEKYLLQQQQTVLQIKTLNKKSRYKPTIEPSWIQPTFMIGFPRSGTTLLDTILRSHKDIEVIEEKPLITNLEKLVKENFNTKLDNPYSLSEDNIMILRKTYFELLRKYKTKNAKVNTRDKNS